MVTFYFATDRAGPIRCRHLRSFSLDYFQAMIACFSFVLNTVKAITSIWGVHILHLRRKAELSRGV